MMAVLRFDQSYVPSNFSSQYLKPYIQLDSPSGGNIASISDLKSDQIELLGDDSITTPVGISSRYVLVKYNT
jgi:hypothetical protein